MKHSSTARFTPRVSSIYINKYIQCKIHKKKKKHRSLWKKKEKNREIRRAKRRMSQMSAEIRWPLLAAPEKGLFERLTVDDMLKKHCGEFGRWQLKHFVLTSLAWALEAFHTMVMIFADREPEWTCVRSDLGCDPVKGGVCRLEPGSWRWSKAAGISTVSEWGLICGDKYKVGLVQALFFGGCMIGQFFSL